MIVFFFLALLSQTACTLPIPHPRAHRADDCEMVTCVQPGGSCSESATEKCAGEATCNSGKCTLPQSLGQGELCSDGIVCKDGLYCNIQGTFTCEPVKQTGAACTSSSSCAAGLYCSQSHICVKRPTEGDSCTDSCYGGDFECISSRCVIPCDGSPFCGPGRICNTSSDLCIPTTVVGEGAGCNNTSGPKCDSSKWLFCGPHHTCLKSFSVEEAGDCQVTQQCVQGAQCVSGKCSRKGEGEPCGQSPKGVVSAECKHGLVCSMHRNKCVSQAEAVNIGKECTDDSFCGNAGICSCDGKTGQNKCYRMPVASDHLYNAALGYYQCKYEERRGSVATDCEGYWETHLPASITPYVYPCPDDAEESDNAVLCTAASLGVLLATSLILC